MAKCIPLTCSSPAGEQDARPKRIDGFTNLGCALLSAGALGGKLKITRRNGSCGFSLDRMWMKIREVALILRVAAGNLARNAGYAHDHRYYDHHRAGN